MNENDIYDALIDAKKLYEDSLTGNEPKPMIIVKDGEMNLVHVMTDENGEYIHLDGKVYRLNYERTN